jgi:polar amino acid transport system permease protein
MSPFSVLWEYRDAFAGGFLVTFELLTLTVAAGTLAGTGLAWLCEISPRFVRTIANGVAFCVSAIPALVLLFWFHYPAQVLLNIVVPPFWTALITLTIINIFAIYRILADAHAEFPKQFVLSALVCGLTPWQVLRHIRLPLLLRASLPRWIDQQVIILQTSVFASLISVEETFRVAQRINSVVYQPVIIYTSMALIFLVTAGSGIVLAGQFRRRFHRDFSEH